jgi:hypothetical protein
MIGYPYLAQNYPAAYLPSAAFQQAYSSNGPFHQSAAAAVPGAMKYNMNVPQFKNNLSATSLQQQPSSVISGYGGFGSSSNLPGNFTLNQNAASASTNLGFDEALSTPYKDPSQYMALQQVTIASSPCVSLVIYMLYNNSDRHGSVRRFWMSARLTGKNT